MFRLGSNHREMLQSERPPQIFNHWYHTGTTYTPWRLPSISFVGKRAFPRSGAWQEGQYCSVSCRRISYISMVDRRYRDTLLNETGADRPLTERMVSKSSLMLLSFTGREWCRCSSPLHPICQALDRPRFAFTQALECCGHDLPIVTLKIGWLSGALRMRLSLAGCQRC
jgi:hypothetical protein